MLWKGEIWTKRTQNNIFGLNLWCTSKNFFTHLYSHYWVKKLSIVKKNSVGGYIIRMVTLSGRWNFLVTFSALGYIIRSVKRVDNVTGYIIRLVTLSGSTREVKCRLITYPNYPPTDQIMSDVSQRDIQTMDCYFLKMTN